MKKLLLILAIGATGCTTTRLSTTPSGPDCLEVKLTYAGYSEKFYACDSVQIQKVRNLIRGK